MFVAVYAGHWVLHKTLGYPRTAPTGRQYAVAVAGFVMVAFTTLVLTPLKMSGFVCLFFR